MKAGYEISFKYDALNHQKKHFKVHENTTCLTEGGIYEVEKGVNRAKLLKRIKSYHLGTCFFS